MAAWGADARYVRLVEQHSASLLRLATLLCRNRQDAEDAVQDALVSVAEAWPRVRQETASAYLRRAVVNKANDQHRARREEPTDLVPDRAVEDLRLLRHEEDRAFVQRVHGLPHQQRAVIVLRYYADVSDADIAELLHCTTQTVRSQASRALAKLRAAQAVTERGGEP